MMFRERLLVLTGCAMLALACRPDAVCPKGTRRAGNYCIHGDAIDDLDGGGGWDAGETPEDDGDSKPGPGSGDRDAGLDGDAEPDGGDEHDGALCLADRDGDGFGVDGVFVPCDGNADVVPGDCNDDDANTYPGAHINRCDDVDNDCDGVNEEPSEEVCNGLDDDCDDNVDEGVANACGTCGELPKEICNGVDDDCDGLTDPNMLERERVFATVFTQPNGGLNGLNVAAFPRPDGGAWILYGGAADSFGNTIVFQGLDEYGLPDRRADSSKTEGTAGFIAESDGKWVVIVSRRRPTGEETKNDSVSLRVQVYRAADMAFVSEYPLVKHVDYDSESGERNDPDDCHNVLPEALAMFEDSEQRVQIALVYENTLGTNVTTTCTTSTKYIFQVLDFDGRNTWAEQKPTELGDLSTHSFAVRRVPCRDEWFVARTRSGTTITERYAIAGGEPLASDLDTFEAPRSISRFYDIQVDCANSDPVVGVVYGYGGRQLYAYLRRWRVDRDTAAVSRLSPDVLTDMAQHVTPLQFGGHTFVVGMHLTNPIPMVAEVDFDAETPVRQLEVVVPPGGTPGQARPSKHVYTFASGATALVATRHKLVAVYMRGSSSDLDDHRAPGDTDPAMAVAYTYGCPPPSP